MTKANSEHDTDDRNADLGRRAKALRKSRALTLQELSQRSGVSRASLSKIERGEMSPTYETMRKLASGLKVALTVLMMDDTGVPDGNFRVQRAGEGAAYNNPLYSYELLSGSPDAPGRTIHLSEMGADDMTDFPEFHSHESLDFFYVLRGRIAALFEGEEKFHLETGDSLTFDGRTPHAFASASEGKDRAKILWVSDRN